MSDHAYDAAVDELATGEDIYTDDHVPPARRVSRHIIEQAERPEWPKVLGDCMTCEHRGVVTWTGDAWRLCAECLTARERRA